MTDFESFWYVATPYTKYREGRTQAWLDACWATAQFIKQGMIVFSPIVHGHPLATHGSVPLVPDLWQHQQRPFLLQAQGLLVIEMPGWEESEGMGVEISLAKDCGMPIRHFDWPKLHELVQS